MAFADSLARLRIAGDFGTRGVAPEFCTVKRSDLRQLVTDFDRLDHYYRTTASQEQTPIVKDHTPMDSFVNGIKLIWHAIRHPEPKVYLRGPNGEKLLQTGRHLTVVAKDGELHCDRCRNGALLACMDSCSCGRSG